MTISRSIVRAGAVACISLCTGHASQLIAQSAAAPLNLTETTSVPGAVLKPGAYTVAIVDTFDDRVVIHVNLNDGDHLTFIGIVKPAPAGTGQSVAVAWQNSAAHKHYLRGYSFPSSYIEFVYPKADAAAIATANDATVIAIDPESESRPELSKLSEEDRKVISLWMLTPTTVGPEHGLEAKRYQPSQTVAANAAPPAAPAPAPTAAPAPPSAPVSSSGTATAPVAAVTPSAPAPAGAPAARVASTMPAEVAENRPPAAVKAYRPALKRLPQTASQMPLLWTVGFSCLIGAGALRVRRSFTA